MGWNILSWALPAIMALLLLSAGIQDARTREIANWKNAAIALMAPLWWVAIGLDPWPGMAIQLGVAAFVFALFVGAFAIGQMGGGDVKLIGALALWLAPFRLLDMLLMMSLAGGALTIVFMIERRWRPREGPVEVPYGVAIAVAGLLMFREPLLNQFTQ
ncbi:MULTISPECIES: A24 family peptidase [Sphingomonas]|uniref:Peptidase n=1 Tax=Sphingomonas adhaesiva TaxID=28212 RepID=A0A2A4I9Q3_9SPHN|nr:MULTISPECIES: prepilin peptidase [Sphingomonas]PCG15239.1 peptidase [Sphingomonas adhaesiva]PZU79284.1 MAG: peptidase [Sphingomonas sp.]